MSPDDIALAEKAARRVAARTGMDYDDARASALVGVWRASLRFRPDAGMDWEDYAELRAMQKVVSDRYALTGWSRRRGELRCPASSIEAVMGRAERCPAADLPIGWEVEAEDAVEAILRAMDGRRRPVLRDLFLRADRATLTAAGAAYGLKKSSVANYLAKLRDAVGDGYRPMGGRSPAKGGAA